MSIDKGASRDALHAHHIQYLCVLFLFRGMPGISGPGALSHKLLVYQAGLGTSVEMCPDQRFDACLMLSGRCIPEF